MTCAAKTMGGKRRKGGNNQQNQNQNQQNQNGGSALPASSEAGPVPHQSEGSSLSSSPFNGGEVPKTTGEVPLKVGGSEVPLKVGGKRKSSSKKSRKTKGKGRKASRKFRLW